MKTSEFVLKASLLAEVDYASCSVRWKNLRVEGAVSKGGRGTAGAELDPARDAAAFIFANLADGPIKEVNDRVTRIRGLAPGRTFGVSDWYRDESQVGRGLPGATLGDTTDSILSDYAWRSGLTDDVELVAGEIAVMISPRFGYGARVTLEVSNGAILSASYHENTQAWQNLQKQPKARRIEEFYRMRENAGVESMRRMPILTALKISALLKQARPKPKRTVTVPKKPGRVLAKRRPNPSFG